MTVPAWIYARFSSMEQAKGHSLERQLKSARAHIERMGWQHSYEREIIDEGRSAFHGDNRIAGSALFAFEQNVRNGQFATGAVLVVESLDRLTRQGHEETVELLRLLTTHGVSVSTTQDGQFYEAGKRFDLAAIITIIVKGELSREEIEKRQKRILAVWDKKIEAIQGGERKAVTAMVPAWIDVDPHTRAMMLNRYRSGLLNQIYDWYIEGRGVSWIEKELNGRSEPTWTMKNNHEANGWNSSSLHKMLKWRAVLGEFEPKARLRGQQVGTSKGIVIADYYPQAISAEKFNQAQAVRAGRQRTGGKTKHTHNNLFLGMVQCGLCGGPAYHQINSWVGQKKLHQKRNGEPARYEVRTNLSYFRCNNWRRRHQCNNSTAIRYEVLEQAVLDYFFDDAIEHVIEPSEQVQMSRNAIAEHERHIALLHRQLANIIDALTEAPIKALAQKAAALELDIEKAEAALADDRKALEVLLGAGSPSDNIVAIQAIAADLNAGDAERRYVARVKTHQAFKRLFEKVVIWDNGDIALWFKGGEVLVFDNDGQREGGTDSYYATL